MYNNIHNTYTYQENLCKAKLSLQIQNLGYINKHSHLIIEIIKSTDII